MSAPLDLTIPLLDLGELLAKLKKAGKLGKPPTLRKVLKAHELKDSRKPKEELLEGMRRVFTGDHEAEKMFDEIFPRGKRHPSADKLYAVGTDLGMQWLAGIRGGWQYLEDIMDECHVETRALAKKYMMPGLIAILGKKEAKIAWDWIYPRVENADEIRLEGRVLGVQLQIGTLHNLKTLKQYAKQFGTTNTRTIGDLFMEALTDLFGGEMAEDAYVEMFPHALPSKIIKFLRLEGRQLAELWHEKQLIIIPTLTDYMRFYDIRGRDATSKYIYEGMREVLDEKKALAAYSELFSQKSNITDQKIEVLHKIGHELGTQWKAGKRTTSHVLAKIMEEHKIGDIRTAERHILAGLEDQLGKTEAEIALETYFSNVHPNAEAIRQYATKLAHQVENNSVTEYETLDEIGAKFNASAETTSKYVYEAFILAFGERKGQKLYEKAFPHDLYAVLGVYNHPILEAGLTEVVINNFEDAQHAPTIKTEKLEGNVKHDVLIENIQEGGWFQKQLARLAPQNETFFELLKLPAPEAAEYTRISIDYMTREDLLRVLEKIEKYADEDTLLFIVLTNYNDPEKDWVKILEEHPNVRVISAELLFRLFGGKTPAIELARKVRDLTRQGKVAALRAWMQKVSIGTAPSFLTGQQNLDQWLDAESEVEDAGEEEEDPDEMENEEDDGCIAGEHQRDNTREKVEEKLERTSVNREPTGKTGHDQRQTEHERDKERTSERNPKIETGKQGGREPEKIQEDLGLTETQLAEHPPDGIGMGQHPVTGDIAGQEMEADLGNLAVSLVPPVESPAQETMLPGDQETCLIGAGEEKAGTAPPAVLENTEIITPDLEHPADHIEKSIEGEQKQAFPAAAHLTIEEQPTREVPLPQPPLTETPAPAGTPATEVENQELKGLKESLPSPPQTPVEEPRVLEELLTESPLLASTEVAEHPTGDGRNPSELDVPVIEPNQSHEEKVPEIFT